MPSVHGNVGSSSGAASPRPKSTNSTNSVKPPPMLQQQQPAVQSPQGPGAGAPPHRHPHVEQLLRSAEPKPKPLIGTTSSTNNLKQQQHIEHLRHQVAQQQKRDAQQRIPPLRRFVYCLSIVFAALALGLYAYRTRYTRLSSRQAADDRKLAQQAAEAAQAEENNQRFKRSVAIWIGITGVGILLIPIVVPLFGAGAAVAAGAGAGAGVGAGAGALGVAGKALLAIGGATVAGGVVAYNQD